MVRRILRKTKTLFRLCLTPKSLALSILENIGFIINDKYFLSLYYRISLGGKLNLNNPIKFTEKLQWLKLYDRKQIHDFIASESHNDIMLNYLEYK